MPQPHGVNAAAFAPEFYRSVLPAILRIALVLIPAFLGMSEGAKRTALSPMQIVLWATLFAGSTYGWYSSRHWGMGMLLPLALTWPVAYMIAATRWRHRRENRLLAVSDHGIRAGLSAVAWTESRWLGERVYRAEGMAGKTDAKMEG